jgi:hypothetical protein
MRKKNIFLFLVFFVFNFSFAQVGEETEENYEEEMADEYNFEKSIFLGANAQLGLPQGKFGENIDFIGWGFGGNVMWKFKKDVAVYGGIDFSFQNYDFQSITEITFAFDEYELKTKNSIVLSHVQIRFYPEVDFFLHPYIEGLIGVKSLLTRTILTDKTNGANDQITSQIENSDFGISFGGAIGFEIPINKNYLFLDVRCSYLKGTSSEYYARKEDDSVFIDPIDVFEIKNSTTDLLVPQIGIKFLIGFGNQNEEEYYDENDSYDEEEY